MKLFALHIIVIIGFELMRKEILLRNEAISYYEAYYFRITK